MDRDTFLLRVGEMITKSDLPAPQDASARLPSPGREDLLDLFVKRATEVDAMVHGPMEASRVPAVVEDIVSGSETFVAWDDLPVVGVASTLVTAGMRRLSHDIAAGERLQQQLAFRDLDCGITGADIGLAESGSVVLVHGPGRPRMASLIPEVHVALLPISAIHRSLAHWAQRSPGAAASTANLVVITGPSRTGDIELHLNLGVHGPRIVHIVLVQP